MKPAQEEPPPIKGAACRAYVAAQTGLRPSQVSVSHSHKRRDKVLAITGMSEETVRERIQCVAPKS